MTPRNKNLILNRVFLAGLLLLALNDHFLKDHYSNWLTGKLSDFAGLLIFPLFLAFLFPRQARAVSLITGIFFIFWKSPWSTPLITLYNKFAPIGITRTIDYSDLLALAVLPLSHYLIPRIDRYAVTDRWCSHATPDHRRRITVPVRLHPVWLALPCSLVFMATSPPRHYMADNHVDGDIFIGASFTIKMPPDQVLETMRKEGFFPVVDTSAYARSNSRHYILENIILPDTRDTLRYVRFSLYPLGNNKTDFYLRYVNKKGTYSLSNWRIMKMYAKYYRRLIKGQVIRELR